MIDHYLSEIVPNKYVEELRCLIDERTAALTEIERSMRLPDSHPHAQALQELLAAHGDPHPQTFTYSFCADEEEAPVKVRISNQGKLHFPYGELDKIISKLLNPATTTMQTCAL